MTDQLPGSMNAPEIENLMTAEGRHFPPSAEFAAQASATQALYDEAERDYEALCSLLHRSLADPTKRLAYAHDIREIIVSGDLAIVRLTWTLTVTMPGAAAVESKEPGLDVFRRQPDGSWKIVRYLGYEAP